MTMMANCELGSRLTPNMQNVQMVMRTRFALSTSKDSLMLQQYGNQKVKSLPIHI